MKELTFSYNWNNKLHCKCFTSIRLSEAYKVGDNYKIFLKQGKETTAMGLAQIIDIKSLYLDQLNSWIAYLDTGYSLAECEKIIRKMYPIADFTKQKLKLILFKYL